MIDQVIVRYRRFIAREVCHDADLAGREAAQIPQGDVQRPDFVRGAAHREDERGRLPAQRRRFRQRLRA
jgi:hypothetical protein